MTADLDGTVDLRAWIGREEIRSDVVSPDLAARYHATLDLPGAPPQEGAPAPRLIYHCMTPQTVPTGMLASDGHPQRGGFLPPVPLPRRMWAGSSIRFHRDIRVGDTVDRVSRIADVTTKEGRTGPLCFVTVDHLLSVAGAAVVSERQNIVFRGPESGTLGKPPVPAAGGDRRRIIVPSTPLLFRYSAILFFAHRIHYDRTYATEVEGYPGLVVHGPLQAALLIHFATEARGVAPDRFTFRSGSPLFDDSAFVLNATDEGESMRLWTARERGPAAMTAEASWDKTGTVERGSA
ncbi:FAS1-like dehydratase domain-containing protein [Methylobacterium pseudosasicola]|uniref:3-methylfumaryl-CoA hydratase n=1 Tax=Methylobacterium pseudosasicola TaxID=582667 RepID=A0A1I4PRU3_9HYPH|nr:MaoC family dehydratase N-terminal domain-containing protein [Methylobacterium pseudosasicola]SFM30572.1 3-methylfumaryl-CoA hydratase [Methylobacterium pseudosasicola]